jgi:RNA polymerase sigma factor for flagellar operon FliA
VPSAIRDDLEGFGAIGLIDAIEKFRPELGYRFETYGSIRIRGAIADGMRLLDWFPRDAARRASGRIRVIDLVDFQAKKTPSGKSLGETVPDSEDSPLDLIITGEESSEVDELVDALPERERTIVLDRYYKNRLLRETARDYALTESRICQLHKRALARLEEQITSLRSA